MTRLVDEQGRTLRCGPHRDNIGYDEDGEDEDGGKSGGKSGGKRGGKKKKKGRASLMDVDDNDDDTGARRGWG